MTLSWIEWNACVNWRQFIKCEIHLWRKFQFFLSPLWKLIEMAAMMMVFQSELFFYCIHFGFSKRILRLFDIFDFIYSKSHRNLLDVLDFLDFYECELGRTPNGMVCVCVCACDMVNALFIVNGQKYYIELSSESKFLNRGAFITSLQICGYYKIWTWASTKKPNKTWAI